MPRSSLELHPDVLRLRAEVDALRAEVARALGDLDDTLTLEKRRLLVLYEARLGPWELRVLRLRCEQLRLRRTIEMVQAARAQRRPWSLAAIDAKLDEELATWTARIAEHAKAVETAQRALGMAMSPEDAKELRAIFLRLVRLLHPDLHPGDEAKLAVWHRVQQAYERTDLAALRALEIVAQEGATPTGAPSSLELLARDRDRLSELLAAVLGKLEAVGRTPPFNLREMLEDEVRVEARRAALDAQVADLDASCNGLRAHLEALTHERDGSPPRTH